jgi:1,4-alpha-glucan branching enzyme
MNRFFAYTNLAKPGLHVWREGTAIKFFLHPVVSATGPGWVEFECDLNPEMDHSARFMLFSFKENGTPGDFESDEFQRELPRLASGDFPDAVWFVGGASRVVLSDPLATTATTLRVHLISQSRFRPSEMYLWDPVTGADRRISQTSLDALGPVFDLSLAPHERAFFNFKFIAKKEGHFKAFEPDFANRLWVAGDGPEIWMHSGTAAIASVAPETRTLTLHYRQAFDSAALLHLWAENGDYVTDVEGVATADGWTTFTTEIYTQLPYACRFHNPGLDDEWEHEEAKRQHLQITDDTEWWTLEGDRALFDASPTPDVLLDLTVANTALSKLEGALFAHVWVNRARGPLTVSAPVDANGSVSLPIYPTVTTSIKFHDAHGRWERNRHAIQVDAPATPIQRYVVLERPPLLLSRPVADLVADPPFRIRRPGAYAEGSELRFVLHAPHAADVDLIGEWTGWTSNPIQLRSTHDGSYWWASVKISDLLAGLPDGRTDYHGVKYQFLFNQVQRLQDPAAGWVEHSRTNSASRLVNHDGFDWRGQQWDRPAPDYYIVYQLHPSRFTNRFQDERPLRRIAREIADNAGYFRELGVTAIQLLPVNEVSSSNSWGYDPAYFYAVENDYCGPDGPDDLKHLVYTCHQHGLAVVLDVVFNHAGGDNILWDVARDSFFDGDTQWGALVNFDHPQCLHFFAQNLVYLANEFRIDAFRLDHTATIVHSAAWDPWSGSVRELGSGGGWQFLHGLRHAVHTQVGRHCLLMAEHLPNEWSLTNYGGPMDSQWGDDFHDRLIEACKRQFGMSRLADALKLSHTASDDWYKVVNYPESHDEVGNVRDRVAFVAGIGQGWRMSKVAAAATLLSRGIPLFFMGAESAEDKQFSFGKDEPLDLDAYLANDDRGRIRAWWKALCRLRRDPSIQGPSPLDVCFATEQLLAFSRGLNGDFFVLLNFGGWSGYKNLGEMNLREGQYRELWNSTWPAFAINAEQEGEHTNGGREAQLQRQDWLQIPDYGAVILQRA